MISEFSNFTLIILPQRVNAAGILEFNILFIPRNISPLDSISTPYRPTNAVRFADAKPKFVVRLATNVNGFAGKFRATEKVLNLITLDFPTQANELFTTLKNATIEVEGIVKPKYFDIDESRSAYKAGSAEHTAPKAIQEIDTSVRKYLPLSYRNAFNFTSPRLRNAVTDDSYHCAMREQTPMVKKPIDHKVSWGKVYAHLLRQPAMAKAAGLLYSSSVQLTAADVQKGCWIYVDLADDSDYAPELKASLDAVAFPNVTPFVKRYAAKLPPITIGEAKTLFTAVTFPVVKENAEPDFVGNFDELFIEANRYQHGFATIVHANQPVSQNLLQEQHDGLHPQKEIGIRLGWEDEQILQWYVRQMAAQTGASTQIDAPLCVMGYNIDVKFTADNDAAWESLNAVQSKGNMTLEGIDFGAFTGELPYQVYPTKIESAGGGNFWLPMYFAHWNNNSIVLPDETASKIYKNELDNKNPVNNKSPYLPLTNRVKLAYGNSYQFRVRLSDISGGTPPVETPTLPLLSESHKALQEFKRYVAPDTVRIINQVDVSYNTDDANFKAESLSLARPLLGYPAALYTGKYTDPVQKLIDSADAIILKQQNSPIDADGKRTEGGQAFGIADPDVQAVNIKVEVETLLMDNLASEDGRQNYIELYNTNRIFNDFDENNADETITIPITYIDEPVLQLLTGAPFSNPANNNCIAATAGEIMLPTARNIRITLTPKGKDQLNYWGGDDKKTQSGKKTILTLRKESAAELDLLIGTTNPQLLQGIYMQPEALISREEEVKNRYFNGNTHQNKPNAIQRLADQLNITANGSTLYAPNGERIHFWCSSRLRHNMAPDNSSLTFANRNELQQHWLVCTTFTINRDWTWDNLDPLSFTIQRKFRFGNDPIALADMPYDKKNDNHIEIKKTASFQAIQQGRDGKIHRHYTKIILIDVVDDTVVNNAVKPNFPDITQVQYKLIPNFKDGQIPDDNAVFETKPLTLPTTVKPNQAPALIGSGIALSPYVRNDKYSYTEARKRYLWLEFDKAPEDPNDALFARVLAYAPDQLLSNNSAQLMKVQKDAEMNLDPEVIRIITPDMNADNSGLNAMQSMIKSNDKDRHFYLLPIPNGLNLESFEMFGFFTYEFRFGHTDRIWSTAQGRFGRPLRIAGLQHPAPTLKPVVNRSNSAVSITAPYAKAFFKGQDVTNILPRTSIWAVLYAQVQQADKKDYRNVLIAEIELNPIVLTDNDLLPYLYDKIRDNERAKITKDYNGEKIEPYNITEFVNNIVKDFKAEQARPIDFGTVGWSNTTINYLMQLYGLPLDTPLSIACVEIFGQITNMKEQQNNISFEDTEQIVQFGNSQQNIALMKDGTLLKTSNNYTEIERFIANEYGIALPNKNEVKGRYLEEKINPIARPLSTNLGKYRILRTSPLVEVPFVCCTDETPQYLGILSHKGSLIAEATMPNLYNINGYVFNASTDIIQGIGDIDNDGVDEIIITHPMGLVILKYAEKRFQLLYSIQNNQKLGNWTYNEAANGTKDWGYKIGTFTGNGANELLLISKKGIVTLQWQGNQLLPTKILLNGEIYNNWKVNTTDKLVGVAKLMNTDETNIVFENTIDMHIVSMKTLNQTFTARTGVRYGGWLFNRADNTVQSFGDFDGDGIAEIFISSPWGIGILKLIGNRLTHVGMQVNGTNLNGYIVNNKHSFKAIGDYEGNKAEEIVVIDNTGKFTALMKLNNNNIFVSTFFKDNTFGIGTEAGSFFVDKIDRDNKSDLFFANKSTLTIYDLNNGLDIKIKNIIPIDTALGNWTFTGNDIFIGAGKFIENELAKQVLVAKKV